MAKMLFDQPVKKESTDEIHCSICLEIVRPGGDRATAKLQCDHEFHLDCIGSAFNAKGVMQCPNCREIGKGNWLYSKSHRSSPERIDEWTHEEEHIDSNNSETRLGVHWCPFHSPLAALSFPEEISSAIAYHEAANYQTIFFATLAASSSSHQRPYQGYMMSHQPSPSLNLSMSSGTYDDPTFHNNWNPTSRNNDVQAHVLPAVDLHYHNWEVHSATYSQASGTASRSTQNVDAPSMRLDSDPFHQFVPAHGSSSGTTGTFMPTGAPSYFTSTQSYPPHVREHYQHRSDPTTYQLFPPADSSSQNSTEAENMRADYYCPPGRDQYYALFPENGWGF